ncbi:hypothetical protein GCM10011416_04800 [Polaribacter pacificus]|uniref:histidine kinase n=1 Tax=Polaribacter pacificus TaxID=1775173 RepID=A0A917HVX7_9FLAO|nr:histidine kinase [Polaribacter pacificus]GGG91251.1 hypothetical protein GCM10011416_04800 [Polaribacter pacificus]
MFKNDQLLLLISYGIIFFAIVTIAIIIFVWKSRKKILQKEVEKKELEIQFQKKILQASIIAQEKERSRIAQELHDDISAKLNVVSLQAYALISEKLTIEETKEMVDTLLVTIKKTAESSRNLAHNLLPPILSEFGLHEAIKELVLDVNNTKAVAIHYTNSLDFTSLNDNSQLHVFRILQELINNSIKHGKSTKIQIDFKTLTGKRTCYYSDNGVGFNVEKIQYKGLGMISLENRILFLNGSYYFSSQVGKGFQYTFNF